MTCQPEVQAETGEEGEAEAGEEGGAEEEEQQGLEDQIILPKGWVLKQPPEMDLTIVIITKYRANVIFAAT